MKSASSAGFTLAEMLVALFITAMVSTAGATLLVSSSQSGKQLSEFSDELKGLEVAQALIRNDVAAMLPMTFDPDDEFGVAGGLAWTPETSDGSLLRFYRNGWLHAQKTSEQSDLQAVEYLLQDGSFIRFAHLPSAKKADFPRRVMFTGVDRVEARIFRKSRWLDEAEFNPFDEVHWPELIELSVFFEDRRSFRIIALSGARE